MLTSSKYPYNVNTNNILYYMHIGALHYRDEIHPLGCSRVSLRSPFSDPTCTVCTTCRFRNTTNITRLPKFSFPLAAAVICNSRLAFHFRRCVAVLTKKCTCSCSMYLDIIPKTFFTSSYQDVFCSNKQVRFKTKSGELRAQHNNVMRRSNYYRFRSKFEHFFSNYLKSVVIIKYILKGTSQLSMYFPDIINNCILV